MNRLLSRRAEKATCYSSSIPSWHVKRKLIRSDMRNPLRTYKPECSTILRSSDYKPMKHIKTRRSLREQNNLHVSPRNPTDGGLEWNVHRYATAGQCNQVTKESQRAQAPEPTVLLPETLLLDFSLTSSLAFSVARRMRNGPRPPALHTLMPRKAPCVNILDRFFLSLIHILARKVISLVFALRLSLSDRAAASARRFVPFS